MFILNIFGIGAKLDIFIASNTLNLIVIGIATGAINYALTPVFVNLYHSKKISKIRDLANSTINCLLLMFLILAGAQVLFAADIANLLFPGVFKRNEQLLIELMRIQSVISIISITIGVLTSLNYMLNNLYKTIIGSIIAGLLQIIFVYFLKDALGIWALVYGLILNQTFILVFLGIKFFQHYKLQIIWNAEFKDILIKMSSLIVSSTFSKSNILVNRYFGSLLIAGSITILHYGLLFISTFSTVVSKGVSIISLRKFSHLQDDGYDFNQYFVKTYSIMLTIVIFITINIVCFSKTVIYYILVNKHFSTESLNQLHNVTLSFLGVFIGGVLSAILVNTYYAKGRTVFVSKMSVIVQIIGIGLKIITFKVYGFFALPIVTSGQYLITSIILLALYKKYIYEISYLPILKVFLKFISASIIFIYFYYNPFLNINEFIWCTGTYIIYLLYFIYTVQKINH